jgi:hypothetical protein
MIGPLFKNCFQYIRVQDQDILQLEYSVIRKCRFSQIRVFFCYNKVRGKEVKQSHHTPWRCGGGEEV